MKIKYGKGKSQYGPGVKIKLSGEEVAIAVCAYLTSRDANISGPRTITVNGELIKFGEIYVDPSGFVVHKGKKFSGRGKERKE